MSGILPQPGPVEPKLSIVLVGKTGVGKSTVMNTLAGKKFTRTEGGPASVTTEVEVGKAHHGDQELVIIDTPGVLNTKRTKKKHLQKDIARSMACAAAVGGPHVFLLVVRADRFNSQDKDAVEIIEESFGDEFQHYTLVVFTYGDKYNPKNVKTEYSYLEKFLHDDDSMHIFENNEEDQKDEEKRENQVSGLVKKINKMVAKNKERNAPRYTSKMLEEAQNIMKEKEAKMGNQGDCVNWSDILSEMVKMIIDCSALSAWLDKIVSFVGNKIDKKWSTRK